MVVSFALCVGCSGQGLCGTQAGLQFRSSSISFLSCLDNRVILFQIIILSYHTESSESQKQQDSQRPRGSRSTALCWTCMPALLYSPRKKLLDTCSELRGGAPMGQCLFRPTLRDWVLLCESTSCWSGLLNQTLGLLSPKLISHIRTHQWPGILTWGMGEPK